MRYSDQGYTPAQVIGIVDAYLFDNKMISHREREQAKAACHIKPFGNPADGVIEPFLPPWIRKYAPKLPARPSPVLSKKTLAEIEALEARKVDLNFKSLQINIGPEVASINARIARLRNPDSQE